MSRNEQTRQKTLSLMSEVKRYVDYQLGLIKQEAMTDREQVIMIGFFAVLMKEIQELNVFAGENDHFTDSPDKW